MLQMAITLEIEGEDYDFVVDVNCFNEIDNATCLDLEVISDEIYDELQERVYEELGIEFDEWGDTGMSERDFV
jgi:hypothetical protein